MSSYDRMAQIGECDRVGMTGVALIAGLLALLATAGCGGGSNGNGGSGGGAASVAGTIAVGTAPSAIVIDSTANKIYVTDFGTKPTGVPCSQSGADVEVIDGATQSTTSVGFAPAWQVTPTAAALNPANHALYVEVATYWNGTERKDQCGTFVGGVQLFNTTSLQPPTGIIVAGEGEGIDVNPTSSDIYVARGVASGDVIVLDSSWNSLAAIPVGTNPVGVAVNATTNMTYVANRGSNNISVIDGASNTVVATVTDPNAVAPVAVAVNATTNTIYVVNSQSNNLTVIDGATNTVTATITVGTAPSSVAVDSQTNFIYVANYGNPQANNAGNVTVINGATNSGVTLTDPKAMNPTAVAANSATNKIYVANWGSNNVTVIDGAHD